MAYICHESHPYCWVTMKREHISFENLRDDHLINILQMVEFMSKKYGTDPAEFMSTKYNDTEEVSRYVKLKQEADRRNLKYEYGAWRGY